MINKNKYTIDITWDTNKSLTSLRKEKIKALFSDYIVKQYKYSINLIKDNTEIDITPNSIHIDYIKINDLYNRIKDILAILELNSKNEIMFFECGIIADIMLGDNVDDVNKYVEILKKIVKINFKANTLPWKVEFLYGENDEFKKINLQIVKGSLRVEIIDLTTDVENVESKIDKLDEFYDSILIKEINDILIGDA